MEPDVVPMHSSTPPPLDDDVEVGAEEDEFGDFGSFSVGVSSTLSFGHFTEPPSSLSQPCPATHLPSSSFNNPVEQYQHTSTVTSGVGGGQAEITGKHCNVDPPLYLPNGYHPSEHSDSGTNTASVVSACSLGEETGFADFPAFAEQAVHPWCCGFSPMGGGENWDGRAAGTNLANSLGESQCDSRQEIDMDSEPRSHAAKERIKDCTTVKHCEQRDAAPIQSSQDHLPQEPAALAPRPEEHHSGEEELVYPGASQRERRPSPSFNIRPPQTHQTGEEPQLEEEREDGEDSVSPLPHTGSESVSEDFASFCDDVSAEEVLEDFDPSLSFPAPQGDEAEELREEDSTDFKEVGFGDHRDQDRDQRSDAADQGPANLPPSDSFADFCSAPVEGVGEGCWGAFRDPRAVTEGKTWAQFREEDSAKNTKRHAEEELDRRQGDASSRRDSWQGSLSSRVQRLFQASFPEVVAQVGEDEEEVPSLSAVLQVPDHHQEDGQEERPAEQQLCPRAKRVQWGMWQQYQDVHNAVGLKFQWGGSHSNRTLLRCLGMDTGNMVFSGQRKQPVIVPAFASNLGMLEPTKEPVPAVWSSGQTEVTAQGPPGPRSGPSVDSMQETLPSSQLAWSSSGLSSSQDGSRGCTGINLDYFGPAENGSSSSSCSNSPPPGVDRELYELTITKLDTSINSSRLEETFNRLMSTAEKTSSSVRKPQREEELSQEAMKVMGDLPNLSFMQAKVLMFPSILVPQEGSAATLD